MKRTVLITGAARGIGAATARAFSRQGDRVVIHYFTSVPEALALCDELSREGGEVFPVCADLRDSGQVRRTLSLTEHRFGGVDVLVNNAAIAQQKPFASIEEEDWDRMFDTNVKSAYFCSRGVLPFMLENRRGWIVNVSSIWGLEGASCEVHYSASKAALIGMTQALAKELGPSGIHVNGVAPGVIDTDMNAHLTPADREALRIGTSLERIGTPEEVADVILFLASPAARYMTGQILSPRG